MCGICGKLSLNGTGIDKEELIAMRDILVHRGPDDEGIYIDEKVGLGHRRLSIIDLAGSKQPLTNEDGTLWIVYNGEIYNYQELRKTLVNAGHQFRTKGDTEVIVHLYEEYGLKFIERLRGMFAFALWDKKQQKLILVRDRLGIKPLYYYSNNCGFYFASEIKAFLKCDGMQPELDEIGLRRYLKYRFVYGERTMFKGVNEIPPGFYMEISINGQIKKTQYWNMDFSPKDNLRFHELSEKLLTTLESSVKMRMISDVPIGSFLSGGIDSSAITGLMARNSSSPVRTFSIGFIPEELNELQYARIVSNHFNSVHQEYSLGAEDFFSLMRKLIWHHDEPLMFPACIPLYILSKNSKQNATVILSGEGSDELFAGYMSNIKAYWLNRFMHVIPDPVKKLLMGIPLNTKYKEVMKKIGYSEEDFIKSFFTTYRDDMISRIYDFSRHQGDEEGVIENELGMNDMEGTFLDRFLAFQMKTYLVALLMKQDKMSMAASIETRVPFLDHKLVELACRFPDSAKVKYTQGKYILKKACESLLPNSIIYRKKMGFPVPIEKWFKVKDNPFIALLTDDEVKRNSFLNYNFIRETIDKFNKGAPDSIRHIWVLLNIEMWRQQFLSTGS